MGTRSLTILALILLATKLFGFSSQAQARINELKFAYPDHGSFELHKLFDKVMVPWARQIREDSGGKIVIRMYTGSKLGTFGNIYDRTVRGYADISFGLHAAEPERFQKSLITALPGITNTLQSSIAFWRLYANGTISDEYKNVHTLAIWHFSPVGVQANKKITKLSEIKGKVFNVPLSTKDYFLEVLKAKPITLPSAEIHTALQRGLVEGFVASRGMVKAYNFINLAKYHFVVPLPAIPAFVIMNKQSYAGLSSKGRAIIDKASGEVFVTRIAKYIDQARASYEKELKVQGAKFSTLAQSDWNILKRNSFDYALHKAKDVRDGSDVLSNYFSEQEKARLTVK